MLSISDCREIVNRYIYELKLPEFPQNLYDPIKYTLQLEAKRLRPSLTLLACNLYSEDISRAIYPALAIEVFHNFTLVHDDIMDRSERRRNNPTVYVKWNPDIAILSGDAMLIKSYELLSHPSVTHLGMILPVFNDTALKVCEGQQYDMDYENSSNPVSIEEYLRMVEYKTAVLVAASLKIGALCGGATDSEAETLYQFGRNIGIAFQLQDDFLDTFGDSGNFGKTTGNDIVTNKKTILLIEALNAASPAAREQLIRWIGTKQFDRDEKITAVKEIYSSLNIENIVAQKIRQYHEKAIQYLDSLQTDDQKKSELRNFSQYLMKRNK